MYRVPYHVKPNRPIAIPPNIALKTARDAERGTVPAKALTLASAAVSHAWLKTSMIRKTRIPIAKALRKPFFLKLTFRRTAIGMPRRIVRPAIAPRMSSWR